MLRVYQHIVMLAVAPVLLLWASLLHAEMLHLPPRPAHALTGAQIIQVLTPLPRVERENRIYEEIASGNVPDFMRTLVEIKDSMTINNVTHTVRYYATPDYCAIGSDDDYFFTPMSPILGQQIADLLSCMLPTRKMADEIYKAAPVKLAPRPIPPSAEMVTVPVFGRHNAMVHAQRESVLTAYPLGALVGGTKKDVIISPSIYTNLKATVPKPVVIYGWHLPNGVPIQPRYNGHQETYADYSHGIRLIQKAMIVDGKDMNADDVLKNDSLCALLSDEGPIACARYTLPAYVAELTPGFHDEGARGEKMLRFTYPPDVSITINAPSARMFNPRKKVRLIFYALPNGNTTAQTLGKKVKEGDDWHFDIQHIGAQTRFIREVEKESNIVTVCLENSARSWGSAWTGKHIDPHALVYHVVDSVMKIFAPYDLRVTLSSHSGGGNFIFTYIDSAASIPDFIERIVFMDSDYRYNDEYGTKLSAWLKTSPRHSLCVLAYNDSIALLNGKPFVSATGGTWFRTKMMKDRLSRDFPFTESFNGETGVHRYAALEGRIEILMKENPGRQIFHTVQVELNGFIHTCLSGTVHENEGYAYFGPRAYTQWIDE